ncbi:MAG: D-beta-D-heptose 7-phosphate kinase / D-beta-D-heptose 1-phosphate adenosyltransferase [Frankiales bacterium]|jgi:rfaE bifunctional protein nucleotidyltransferase chain/domain|nr:D-beta-D-heptose 7-phosphate kinase / D-beta-D-heptose 1-phosphate adenosyltransferase [Frankiales bacterium]
MTSRLLVVGDALLDIDVEGTSSRLCPDAPAPVVDVGEETLRPGGAALAAVLAASDGHEVVLVTPLGDDADAGRLVALLEPVVRVIGLETSGTTAVKRRVRVGGQTLARLDTGQPGRILDRIPAEVLQVGADAVLVSDYGRGATRHAGVRQLLAGLAPGLPVVWDPHPRGAPPVPGVRLATPNAAEATAMAAALPGAKAISSRGDDLASVGCAAEALVAAWEAGAVVVTMGSRGALLSHGHGAPTVVPAGRLAHGDACGAGDRFASRAATLLAEGKVTLEAVSGATAAATAFVAAGGAAGFSAGVPAPASDFDGAAAVVTRVRSAGGTVVATGGCFDLLHAGHVASLTAARSLGDCLVVCLNSDASVRRLKGPSRPVVPQADRVRVLEALSCVDAVAVFDEDSPAELLQRLQPDLWAKGGDYAGVVLPEASVLRGWGGQAVVLPYLEGRSTSSIVRAMGNVEQTEEVS